MKDSLIHYKTQETAEIYKNRLYIYTDNSKSKISSRRINRLMANNDNNNKKTNGILSNLKF